MDEFFDAILVMVDYPKIRAARISLVATVASGVYWRRRIASYGRSIGSA